MQEFPTRSEWIQDPSDRSIDKTQADDQMPSNPQISSHRSAHLRQAQEFLGPQQRNHKRTRPPKLPEGHSLQQQRTAIHLQPRSHASATS